MNLSPQQLEELGRRTLGGETVDKIKQKKDEATAIYNAYNFINDAGNLSSNIPFSTIMKNSVNKYTGTALGQALSKPHLPTIDKLPDMVKQRAELIKVSNQINKKGMAAGLRRMEKVSPTFTLDPQLSTTEYVVAINKTTGKVEIAFRGTEFFGKIKSGFGKGLPEPIMWANILAKGNEGRVYDQHNIEEIIEKITSKYPVEQIEHISGYSMGATKAHRMADMLGKDTTLLNPFIGKNMLSTPNSPNSIHNIFRTTEDLASAQAMIRAKIPDNFRVSNIDPIAIITDKTPFLKRGSISHHALEHFTQEGDRINEVNEANKVINERVEQFHRETEGVTPEQKTALQNEMMLELEPELKIISNEIKKFKTSTKYTRGIIRGGGALVAGGIGYVASEKILRDLGVDNEYVLAGVSGGISGAVGEKAFAQLAGITALGNIRSAVLSGGLSTVAQVGTADLLNKALLNAGVNKDTAGIISESAGGAVGGGTSVAIPLALQKASQITAQTASRLSASLVPELVGTELTELTTPLLLETGAEVAGEVGAEVAGELLAETVGEVAAETALEVGAEAIAGGIFATNWWNPVGWIAGAALAGTLIAGGIRIGQALNKPAVDYILHPTRNEEVDNLVANDETVKRLINDFNDRGIVDTESVRRLEDAITWRVLKMDGVPRDYGYNARLIPAPEGQTSRTSVVYPYDYSQIPENVRNMNAYEYRQAVGDAKLYSEHPMEYYHLTDAQKQHIINEYIDKHPEILNDRDFAENANLNFRLAKVIDVDTDKETQAERDSIIRPILEQHRADVAQQEAIQQGIDKYNRTVALTDEEHRLFSEFIRTSPEVQQFISNGDINGLNRFLHSSITRPDIAGRIFNQLQTSENREELITILHNNLPQFDALGKVMYISTADKPVEISAERQRTNLKEAHSIHLASKYHQGRTKLQETTLGNKILQDPEINKLINKGGLPEEINKNIDKYYKTHPTFARAVRSGRVQVPKFTESGEIVYKTHTPEVQSRDAHIQRRQQIHQVKTEETPEQKTVESQ